VHNQLTDWKANWKAQYKKNQEDAAKKAHLADEKKDIASVAVNTMQSGFSSIVNRLDELDRRMKANDLF
jgi:hypothetical protein